LLLTNDKIAALAKILTAFEFINIKHRAESQDKKTLNCLYSCSKAVFVLCFKKKVKMSKHHYKNKYFQKDMEKHTKHEEEQVLNEELLQNEPDLQQQEQEISATETENREVDLEDKCNELNDKNLRLMAEFDNYRKRTIKEKADLIKTANENVLADMLTLVDDFERAKSSIDTATDIDAVKEGIELIYSKFGKFLLQNGVSEIPATQGEEFNTEFHEAVTLFPAASEDLKGKIIDCVSKGYTLNDKVIRFAKVVVGE
jgi:molecular chaperone GrpE